LRGEERVEAELAIEFQGEPATAPLARTLEREFVQPDAHHAVVIGGRGAIVGEEGNLAKGVRVGRVGGERLAPGGALRVIDLAEIKYLALHDAAVKETFVFDHTPVSVFLAILLPQLRTQKHIDPRAYTRGGGWEASGSSLQAILRMDEGFSLENSCPSPPKIIQTKVESAKSG